LVRCTAGSAFSAPEDAAGRETKNAPPGAGMPQMQPFPRTQSRAFPIPGAF